MKKPLLMKGLLGMLAISVMLLTGCKKDDKDNTPNLPKTAISGQILNSQTGDGLANATLSFYLPSSKKSGNTANYGQLIFTVITDESGYYDTENAFAGVFVLVITADDFYTEVINNFEVFVNPNNNDFGDLTITRELGVGDGVLRIVLTWGEYPEDIDSHLSGPIAGLAGRFHCYYGNSDPNESVNLDVDDVYSYGPETVTILNWVNGVYRYSVHNYDNQYESGAAEIHNSPTQVRVYNNAGLLYTFNCPNASETAGDTWRVFEINVSGGVPSFTAINSFHDAYSSSDMEIFKSSKGKQKVKFGLDIF